MADADARRDHRRAAIKGQNVNVFLANTRSLQGLSDVGGSFGDMQLCDAIATAHRETLPHIDLREVNLSGDIINNRTGDIQLRAGFNSLQAR